MGTFRQRATIFNPEDSSRYIEAEMVVDSGATYTWMPMNLLFDLNLRPAFKRKLKLANKTIIERDAAIINIKVKDEVLPTICIFGDKGSEPLLGAVTLEKFGLAVDPVNKTLIPIPSLMTFILNFRFERA